MALSKYNTLPTFLAYFQNSKMLRMLKVSSLGNLVSFVSMELEIE